MSAGDGPGSPPGPGRRTGSGRPGGTRIGSALGLEMARRERSGRAREGTRALRAARSAKCSGLGKGLWPRQGRGKMGSWSRLNLLSPAKQYEEIERVKEEKEQLKREPVGRYSTAFTRCGEMLRTYNTRCGGKT